MACDGMNSEFSSKLAPWTNNSQVHIGFFRDPAPCLNLPMRSLCILELWDPELGSLGSELRALVNAFRYWLQARPLKRLLLLQLPDSNIFLLEVDDGE